MLPSLRALMLQKTYLFINAPSLPTCFLHFDFISLIYGFLFLWRILYWLNQSTSVTTVSPWSNNVFSYSRKHKRPSAVANGGVSMNHACPPIPTSARHSKGRAKRPNQSSSRRRPLCCTKKISTATGECPLLSCLFRQTTLQSRVLTRKF